MAKYIEISCSEQMKDIICLSLRRFALIAYPQAPNSECNLVARDALLNAADLFEDKFSALGVGVINRRLRVMLKTAIEAHYNILAELEHCVTKKQCEIMLKVCNGEVIDNAQLIAAQQIDKQT